MGVFSSLVDKLSSEFQGESVELLAVVEGQVDKAFRSNYATAKQLVNEGKLKEIVVVVEVDSANFLHTLVAVGQAIGGVALHEAASFRIEVANLDYKRKADELETALKALGALAGRDVEEVVSQVVADVKQAVAPVVDAVKKGATEVVDEAKKDSADVTATAKHIAEGN